MLRLKGLSVSNGVILPVDITLDALLDIASTNPIKEAIITVCVCELIIAPVRKSKTGRVKTTLRVRQVGLATEGHILRPVLARLVPVLAPRRRRRHISLRNIIGDLAAVAQARVAPSAAAGGAENQPVARLHRHARRLEELLL